MAGERYDSDWKEVEDINGRVLLESYAVFAFKGLGILVFTWSTVVLLGGFVSMIDKQDFWNLTVITLVQTLWIDTSFIEKLVSARDLYVSSFKSIRHLLTGTDKTRGENQELPVVKRVLAAVCTMVALVHGVILCSCILCMFCFMLYGLYITACLSIRGLMEHSHYGEADEDRINMDPAHNVLYFLCLAQVALYLYRLALTLWLSIIVQQVSQAYGFQDGGRALQGYYREISNGCLENPSSVRERNLITYAIERMESNSALSDSFLSGTLILDRLLTRQHSYKTTEPPNLIEQEEEEEEETQQQQQFCLEEVAPLIKKERKENKKQHQQTEQKIIRQQHKIIKRLILRSASSADILEKLLQTLESRRSDDRKMSEASARIVKHVANGICLRQFPEGIQSISALINTFEQYHRLQPHQPSSSNTSNGQEKEQGNTLSSGSDSENSESDSEPDSDNNVDRPPLLSIVLPILHDFWRREIIKDKNSVTTSSTSKSESDNGVDQPSSSESNRSKTNPFHGYKELVLTGLRILWKLAGNEENCTIISNTEHLVSKIMAPTSYDLVHRAGHSAWSTMVSERSLGVMLRLMLTTKGDISANLRQQISSDEGAITTMDRIVTCQECKGGELQMKAMQILTQLCMKDTTNRGNLTKMFASIFANGDSCDGSIRRAAGNTLVTLFLDGKSIGTLLPTEESNEFVGDLANILLKVGDNNTCRRISAQILEHLCIHYTENEQHLSTLKDTMVGLMPKVLREILSSLTGEEENPGYARSGTDVESQVTTYNDNNGNRTSSSHGFHKLHITLLSLCVTACDKLHLDLGRILLGGGDQGGCVAFSLPMKMAQLNKDIITADNLKAMKLITRMVIAAMKKLTGHDTVVPRADLKSLMDLLTSISETMLDLEGSMVFAAGTNKIPATADTLDSLVKQAQQLHIEIMNQESEINVS